MGARPDCFTKGSARIWIDPTRRDRESWAETRLFVDNPIFPEAATGASEPSKVYRSPSGSWKSIPAALCNRPTSH
jgi:hypothetical protein